MSEAPTRTGEPRFTDGNSLAGPLAELFAVDVTTATAVCAHCGRRGVVAELHVYAAGPGTVARCPACQEPVLRFVRTAESLVLDLRGAVSLSVSMVN